MAAVSHSTPGAAFFLFGLVQALHSPFLLQTPLQKLLLFLLLNNLFEVGFFFSSCKKQCRRQARSSVVPWPCPSPASPLAGAFSSQSLRTALGEVSPRMEPFPGVAMEIQQAHPLLGGLQDSPRTRDRWGQADIWVDFLARE